MHHIDLRDIGYFVVKITRCMQETDCEQIVEAAENGDTVDAADCFDPDPAQLDDGAPCPDPASQVRTSHG